MVRGLSYSDLQAANISKISCSQIPILVQILLISENIFRENHMQPRCSPCLCLCVGKETDSNIDEVQRQSPAPLPESLGAGFSHWLNQLDPEIQELQQDGGCCQQPPPLTVTALPLKRSEASTSSAKPKETLISCLFCCLVSGRCGGRGGRVRRITMSVFKYESSPRDNDLEVAYFLFKRFRYLFADLILKRKESYSIFETQSAKEAFKLVAVELGYMYDVLYTKVTIINLFSIPNPFPFHQLLLYCFCSDCHLNR
ncbi:hypothetical protein QYF36_024729 [Acer negundo]|nr:hypothetical protein QYF36_024729 [Acer negundo]